MCWWGWWSSKKIENTEEINSEEQENKESE